MATYIKIYTDLIDEVGLTAAALYGHIELRTRLPKGCCDSVQSMAAILDVSESSIKRSLSRLQEIGAITKTKRASNSPACYRANPMNVEEVGHTDLAVGQRELALGHTEPVTRSHRPTISNISKGELSNEVRESSPNNNKGMTEEIENEDLAGSALASQAASLDDEEEAWDYETELTNYLSSLGKYCYEKYEDQCKPNFHSKQFVGRIIPDRPDELHFFSFKQWKWMPMPEGIKASDVIRALNESYEQWKGRVK